MKKLIALLLCGTLCMISLAGCGSSKSSENGEVYVYNWGEYIDPETITMFEEETGIKVIYDEFDTNEAMYPKVEAGSSAYDIICPSESISNYDMTTSRCLIKSVLLCTV